MDTRRRNVSRRPGKARCDSPARGVPSWLLHPLLGSVLVAAGALKLYQLVFEAPDEVGPPLLLMAISQAEILGGIWMICGFAPGRTRVWAAAAFGGLAASSLLQVLAGHCSCGCFGALSLSPWFVLLFDIAAVAALLTAPAQPDPEEAPSGQTLRLSAFGGLALLIALVGWRQADWVTVAGRATAGNRPLDRTSLAFTGESGKFVLRTDHDGNFRLPRVRPGLYAVTVPGRVAEMPRPGPNATGRGPGARQASRRPGQGPSSSTQPRGGEPLWIEIAGCSDEHKFIEFK